MENMGTAGGDLAALRIQTLLKLSRLSPEKRQRLVYLEAKKRGLHLPTHETQEDLAQASQETRALPQPAISDAVAMRPASIEAAASTAATFSAETDGVSRYAPPAGASNGG